MTFNVGQGAGTAVEDAVVLARELRENVEIGVALRRYEAARRRRTASLVNAASALGRLGAWSNPVACVLREQIIKLGWERIAFRKVSADVAYGLSLRGALPVSHPPTSPHTAESRSTVEP
jgi:2-polyprenyl-6-methoxyphenol hydroxylase-like FAD-dependent oxidoreductase